MAQQCHQQTRSFPSCYLPVPACRLALLTIRFSHTNIKARNILCPLKKKNEDPFPEVSNRLSLLLYCQEVGHMLTHKLIDHIEKCRPQNKITVLQNWRKGKGSWVENQQYLPHLPWTMQSKVAPTFHMFKYCNIKICFHGDTYHYLRPHGVRVSNTDSEAKLPGFETWLPLY